MVGRKQRRFIVNVEKPPTLTDRATCQAWITDALAQAAAIVRDYLPLKGKDHPADRLAAAEVVELRDRWVGPYQIHRVAVFLIAHPLTSPPTALRRRNLADDRASRTCVRSRRETVRPPLQWRRIAPAQCAA